MIKDYVILYSYIGSDVILTLHDIVHGTEKNAFDMAVGKAFIALDELVDEGKLFDGNDYKITDLKFSGVNGYYYIEAVGTNGSTEGETHTMWILEKEHK